MVETENQQEDQTKPNFPGIQEFFVNTSLYTEFNISNEGSENVFRIIHTSDPIDCACLQCGTNSIFQTEGRPLKGNGGNTNGPSIYSAVDGDKNVKVEDYIYQKEFTCSRNPQHKLLFLVQIRNGLISKIGQSPSFADIAVQGIKQYQSILGKHYKEYSKAIGLYAHGIGIGSFAYLRRIVENFLIKPAHAEAKTRPGWDEEKYQNARVREKMGLLKSHLPPYLVQNNAIYAIISKGLHELSEEECKTYFPVLRTTLELVLTDLITKKEHEKKRKEMQIQIDKIAGETQ